MAKQQLPSQANSAAARTSAAWLYRRGTTVIRCTGSDRIDFLHRMTTNDLTKLQPDHGIQTVVVNEKARIIDVLSVLQGQDEAFLLGSAGTAATVIPWLRKYIITDDVKLTDVTSQFECIEVLGPQSSEVVQGLLSIDCSRWSLGQWVCVNVDDTSVIVVRVPSSCELSYLLIAERSTLSTIATALATPQNHVPELIATDAEYLRVLSGMGAFDHEWSEAYNPLEAGLLHLTSFTKGCYIGQEVIARLDSYNKVKQRIMGLMTTSEISEGDVIMVDDKPVGVVTTVTPACDGTHWLALGYVRGEHAISNTPVKLQSQGAILTAVQHLPPLVDPSCP